MQRMELKDFHANLKRHIVAHLTLPQTQMLQSFLPILKKQKKDSNYRRLFVSGDYFCLTDSFRVFGVMTAKLKADHDIPDLSFPEEVFDHLESDSEFGLLDDGRLVVGRSDGVLLFEPTSYKVHLRKFMESREDMWEHSWKKTPSGVIWDAIKMAKKYGIYPVFRFHETDGKISAEVSVDLDQWNQVRGEFEVTEGHVKEDIKISLNPEFMELGFKNLSDCCFYVRNSSYQVIFEKLDYRYVVMPLSLKED